jgi:hypothetical protein
MSETISLPALARQIAAEHAATRSALSKSLQHARCAGDLLINARTRCASEGRKWRQWLTDYPQLSERTARLYVRVAKHWTRVKNASSLREAIEMLREPKSGNSVAAKRKVSMMLDGDLVEAIKQLYNGRTKVEAVEAALTEVRCSFEVKKAA